MTTSRLFIIVPCYNEEAVLPWAAEKLLKKLNELIEQEKIQSDSRIVFVNDGSKDQTWSIIKQLHFADQYYSGINLSRNRGHQNALLAGILTCQSEFDCCISIDADLQDDIDAIDTMIDKFHAGNDIVYGVRSNRDTDTFFKRFTAQSFYRFMNSLGANTVYNHADFRLMSRRAVEGLSQFKENNLFLRGIVPLIGFPTATVEYARKPRTAGESKYPLSKMLSFAMEGITSLSVKPLRMIASLGGIISVFSIFFFFYTVIRYFRGETVSGWSSLMVSVWATGGLIMLSLGVVGEYVGKIYLETKERPRFLVQEYLK